MTSNEPTILCLPPAIPLESCTGNTPGILPSEHEIAFLTLLVGGAMVRVDKRVKAVFVGAGGLLNARLAAERIERMVSDVQIGG